MARQLTGFRKLQIIGCFCPKANEILASAVAVENINHLFCNRLYGIHHLHSEPEGEFKNSCLQPITAVTWGQGTFIDSLGTPPYSGLREALLRDIHEVLRRKQAQQAELGKEIEALQTAAEQLRNVAHLLDADEEDEKDITPGRG